MINSSSIKDKQTLNKWTLRLQSEHPELKDLINMSEEEKLKLDKEVGSIYTNLLTVKCKEESKKAITYEGWDKMVGAFAIFGNASSRVITNHPNVRKTANGFSRYVDMTKLDLMD
ncbi:hypothetical protein EV06_1498 [Prochlorococcus sp. MIT 0602]|nr:hypothetical protein EV06_1498 [Prochlorococcus sp. MIT 0602]KGG17179.1 hypothetical protein EV07_0614 [Prochlorococcus sp. MIT 0603]